MIRVAKLTEAAFQKQVIDAAHLFLWKVAHFRPAMTKDGRWVTPVAADGKGFPDLIIVRHRIVAAELKVGNNVPTEEQIEWLDRLRIAGVATFIWYPEDWDKIMEVLR